MLPARVSVGACPLRAIGDEVAAALVGIGGPSQAVLLPACGRHPWHHVCTATWPVALGFPLPGPRSYGWDGLQGPEDSTPLLPGTDLRAPHPRAEAHAE